MYTLIISSKYWMFAPKNSETKYIFESKLFYSEDKKVQLLEHLIHSDY